MAAEKSLDLEHISYETGGFISANKNIFNNLNLTKNTKYILKESVKGTPIIKIGSNYPKIMIVAGIHGNELAPQISALNLIDQIHDLNLLGTVYIVPFACPKASMLNSRHFDGGDLNRLAHIEGSVSNLILEKAIELDVSSIGDFHSSAPNSNPGKEGIFCTQVPTPGSFRLADFIAKVTNSEKILYPSAGIPFKGALEDEANLKGIPSVTCEVLSAIGYANENICNRSISQMKAFMQYYGLFDRYME